MPGSGSWIIIQDYSASPTATFVGNGTTSYRFEVDTHASGNGNASYDSYTEVDYSYSTSGVCPGGDAVCDLSVCANLTNNASFCGACGTACAIGHSCIASACN